MDTDYEDLGPVPLCTTCDHPARKWVTDPDGVVYCYACSTLQSTDQYLVFIDRHYGDVLKKLQD